MLKPLLKALALPFLCAILLAVPNKAAAETSAKQIFGHQALPDKLRPASHGFYSKGCLAGGVAMPVDGPAWQVMRLSRNRRWGHPVLISIIEQLALKARKDGWNGLMVGDISQPRGGPMLTGHRSHQIGLDADLWFMPMPARRLSYQEREATSAVSVLKRGTPYVDDSRWTKAHERVLYHAAAFPEVERILVHPGVKKKLCETVKGDRAWLRKIRPFYGHHYHFHLRIGCQKGSPGCRKQQTTPAGTGCGKPLKWWFDVALKPQKPAPKPKKPKKPKILTLRDLPAACRQVAEASAKAPDEAVFKAASLAGFTAPAIDLPARADPLAALSSRPIEAGASARASYARHRFPPITGDIPVPTPRPGR